MKRLFFIILGFPFLLYSFQPQNLEALLETSYRSRISKDFIDSSSIDLFLIRAKYATNLTDNIGLFVQEEYSDFVGLPVFPYIKTNGGKLYLRDALFKFDYGNFGGNVGRFVPTFNGFLSMSLLDLPTIHYPVFNELFLNDRINGAEGYYRFFVKSNIFLLDIALGENDIYKYKLFSVMDNVGENITFSFYGGGKDTSWNNLVNYTYGGYVEFKSNQIFFIGEIGKGISDSLYYSIEGRIKFSRLSFGLFLDRYGANGEIASSVDFWLVKNKFDINPKVEINLNDRRNRMYIMFKGII